MTFDGATTRPAQRRDGALIDASVRNMEAPGAVKRRVSSRRERSRLGGILGCDGNPAQANSSAATRAARFSFQGRNAAAATQASLLERHLGEAAQLSAVQLVDAGFAQQLDRAHPDA